MIIRLGERVLLNPSIYQSQVRAASRCSRFIEYRIDDICSWLFSVKSKNPNVTYHRFSELKETLDKEFKADIAADAKVKIEAARKANLESQQKK